MGRSAKRDLLGLFRASLRRVCLMTLLDFRRFRHRGGFLGIRTQVLKTLITSLIGLLTPLHALSSRNSWAQ